MAFTGVTDAAAVVVATAGAVALGATFGVTEALLDTGPLANDGAGAEKVDAAGATGFAGPPWNAP